MNRWGLWISVFAAAAIASPASAQEVTNLPVGTRQSVGLDVGLQSAFVTRATYSRYFDSGLLYGRFTFPFAAPDARDLGFEAGGQTSAIASGNWKLQVSFAPVVRLTENDFFSATAFGIRGALLPGYQSDRWGLMAEVGYEKMLATHINHSSFYRSVAYSGAKDGWYSSTGGTLQVGVRGGHRVGRVELSAAAGLLSTERLNPVAPPFYGRLGSAYAF